MFANRAYSSSLLAPPDRGASLLYFAAAIPAVGFVYGAADLARLNAAAVEGHAESRSSAPQIDTAPGRAAFGTLRA
jgi:hypothetical protein